MLLQKLTRAASARLIYCEIEFNNVLQETSHNHMSEMHPKRDY